jgi:superfamily II DNA or RNA helicase
LSTDIYRELESYLSYKDQQADYQFHKVMKQLKRVNAFLSNKSFKSDEKQLLQQRAILSKQLKELDAQRRISLLRSNEFPSGLLPRTLDWLIERKLEYELVDKRVEPKKNSVKLQTKVPFPDLRHYQKTAVKKLLDDGRGIVVLPTGCHAKGTKILMFDGSIKKVEDIVVGDLLMGPDSSSREVLQLCRGRQEMVKVIPTKGEPFVVNLDHILSLEGNGRYEGTLCNIRVRDYYGKSKDFKNQHKLYRRGVDFSNNEPLEIPPYILGIWLGDGMSRTCGLTTADTEIKNAWLAWGRSLGLKSKIIKDSGCENVFLTNGQTGEKANPAFKLLKSLNLILNKHIPFKYLTASREARYELLAGLLDTDGSLSCSGFDFIQKNRQIAEGVVFLARSLGLAAYISECEKSSQRGTKGKYFRVSISGETSLIPTKLPNKKAAKRKQIKSVLRTGFKLEMLPVDDYFGFTLDKDGLYLLGDFTVTHNTGKTVTAAKMLWSLGVKTLIITPNKSITDMMEQAMTKFFGSGSVEVLNTKTVKLKKPISICNIQSLVKIPPAVFNDVDCVVIDEFHHSAAETYQEVNLNHLKNVFYRIGLTATNFRNDGADMALEGVLSEVLYEYPVQTAIKEGYLTKPRFKIIPMPMELSASNYQKAYKEGIVLNEQRNHTIAEIASEHKSQKMLILVQHKEHGEKLKELIQWAEFIHGEEKDDVRQKMLKDFETGKLNCLIGTSVIGEGVDLPSAEVLIMAGGGKSRSQIIQNIGRVLRIKPGKKEALIYDFDDQDDGYLQDHSEVRQEIYSEYDVE